MSSYYSANFPELSKLEANCKKRSIVAKFIVMDSKGMNLQDANTQAIKNGKLALESHYFISKKGIINSVRPEEYYTEFKDELFNKYSIVIQMEGEFTWENIGALQYNALLNLVFYLKDKYKTYKQLELLSDYEDINNPGPNFPIEEINSSIDNNLRCGLGANDISAITTPIKSDIYLTSPYTTSREILVLKYKMKKAGINKVVLNDVYDEETAKIVNSLKYINGLTVDSICTPQITNILDNLIEKGIGGKKYARKPYFKRFLYLANTPITGNDVLAVQEKLYNLGIYKNDLNSQYDKPTMESVKKFQKTHALSVTGNVDPNTWKRLFNTKTVTFSRLLFYDEGSPIEGSDVLAIQVRLYSMGYKCPTNGIFDVDTQSSVKHYQSDNNFEPTGSVNYKLFSHIMDE